MLESDEFLLWNPIVMEIWRCENTYFSPKCSTTWDDASESCTVISHMNMMYVIIVVCTVLYRTNVQWPIQCNSDGS